MTEQNPEKGHIPGAPNCALSHKAELILFLEKFDHLLQKKWQNLLSLQEEQLCRLASLVETKRPPNGRLPQRRQRNTARNENQTKESDHERNQNPMQRPHLWHEGG